MATESRGIEPLVVATLFTTLATICGVLRFYVRMRIVRQVQMEDWLILIAIVFSITETAMVWQQVKYGLGKHIQDLSLHEITMGLKYLWFSIMLYIPSLTFVKISIILQYRRLFIGRKTEWVAWGLLGFVVIYGLWALFSGIFACYPVAKVWDFTMKGYCMPKNILWYSNGAINVVTDLAILLLPMPSLWAMTMERKKKIMVIFIFALGGFVCVVSLLRIWAVHTALKTTDPTWDLTNAAIYSNVEMNVAIMCASLPMARKFISRCFSNFFSVVKRSGSGSSQDPLTRNSATAIHIQPAGSADITLRQESHVDSMGPLEPWATCDEHSKRVEDPEMREMGKLGNFAV